MFYLKYRPQKFADLVGLEPIAKTLLSQIKKGKVGHAYLFYGPRGTGKCVKFDTQIVDTSTGELLTIEELYKRKQANLLTLDSDYKLRFTNPIDFVDDGCKPCYKVVTALGREVEVTLSHPFLTIKGWKQLSELKVGERIGVSRVIPIFGDYQMPDYKVRLLAHLIAEGSLADPQQVGFTSADQVLIEDFIEAASQFENVKIVGYNSGGARTTTYRVHQKVIQNYINQPGEHKNPVVGFMKELGLAGRMSRERTIPQIVFRLPKRSSSLFLRVLYSGDGGAYLKTTPTIAYYSSSQALVKQIQHLLLRFGIISRIRYKPVRYLGKMREAWNLEITHRESLLTFIDEIGLLGEKEKNLKKIATYFNSTKGNPNRDTVPKEIYELVRLEKEKSGNTWVEVGKSLGYKVPKKASPPFYYSPSRDKLGVYAEVLESEELSKIANSDLYWDEIVGIEYTGDFQVYDLTIKDTYNFVANDIVVHNTTTARLLAKAVNCEAVRQLDSKAVRQLGSETARQQEEKNAKLTKPQTDKLNTVKPSNRQTVRLKTDFEPCNKCDSCRAIVSGTHLDLIEIDAASNRGIDDIRSLREKIKLAPSRGPFKVYVVDEVHMLTTEAFNALLKTLEEPPKHAIFILCTTEFHKVLPTIRSRCEQFEFKRATIPDIVKKLKMICKEERAKVSKTDLQLIAKSAKGGFRDGETLLEQVIVGGQKVEKLLGGRGEDVSDFVELLILAPSEPASQKAILFINRLFEEGVSLEQFTKNLLFYLRDLLLIKAGVGERLIETTKEQYAKMSEQAARTPEGRIKETIKIFSQAEEELKRAVIPQLPLEMAVVELSEVARPPCFATRSGRGSEKWEVGGGTGDVGSEINKAKDEEDKTGKEDQKLLKKILKNWNSILAAIKPHNHSVEALLRSSRPIKAIKGVLTLEVFYPFHKERLEVRKNRNLVEEVVSNVIKVPVRIKCVLGEKKK